MLLRRITLHHLKPVLYEERVPPTPTLFPPRFLNLEFMNFKGFPIVFFQLIAQTPIKRRLKVAKSL